MKKPLLSFFSLKVCHRNSDRKKHVRVFLKLVINHLQNGNSYRTYCKINH